MLKQRCSAGAGDVLLDSSLIRPPPIMPQGRTPLFDHIQDRRAGRIRRPQSVDRQRLLPVAQAPQVGAGVFFTASATSRISAFSSSSSSTLRRSASASSLPSPAFRLRRGADAVLPFCAAFLFLACNAAIPPSRYALTQLWTVPILSRAVGRPASAACRPAPARSPWSLSPTG